MLSCAIKARMQNYYLKSPLFNRNCNSLQPPIKKSFQISFPALLIQKKRKNHLSRQFTQLKKKCHQSSGKFQKVKLSIPELSRLSTRPDLSKTEIIKFRLAWREAIEKNKVAGKRILTVRDLNVVKITYKEGQQPWSWEVYPKKLRHISIGIASCFSVCNKLAKLDF
ncbi:hypothetical protein CRE_00581 [Caenorhabditis remanei]|uniref:Uncharacterized protein n=1 Tax=Caenorhabditis remanei TaxID=31234 RepID=E3LD89_CAERE|nr:hypothetical protein CRE_00581 [Caenorhabditis remanei]